MDQKKDRPLILELDAFHAQLRDIINGAVASGLPCYLLDMILSRWQQSIAARASQEVEILRREEVASRSASEGDETSKNTL